MVHSWCLYGIQFSLLYYCHVMRRTKLSWLSWLSSWWVKGMEGKIIYLRLCASIDWLVCGCVVAFTHPSGLWWMNARVTVFIFLVYSVTCRLQETAPRLFTDKHYPESFRLKLHTVWRENSVRELCLVRFCFKFLRCCCILVKTEGNMRAVACWCLLDISQWMPCLHNVMFSQFRGYVAWFIFR